MHCQTRAKYAVLLPTFGCHSGSGDGPVLRFYWVSPNLLDNPREVFALPLGFSWVSFLLTRLSPLNPTRRWRCPMLESPYLKCPGKRPESLQRTLAFRQLGPTVSHDPRIPSCGPCVLHAPAGLRAAEIRPNERGPSRPRNGGQPTGCFTTSQDPQRSWLDTRTPRGKETPLRNQSGRSRPTATLA
jgi:hypothetical protein